MDGDRQKARCESCRRAACEAIATLLASPCRDHLQRLADFGITRKY
ncbi:MAG: hypothetical protein HY322_02500 [Betaproteobacteria bacterium]|nr:hypothetical protein [Betaproteobacteria bacterium]